MSRSVAVAAHYSVAWKRKSVLRPYHVYDSILGMTQSEQCKPELIGIAQKSFNLLARNWIGNGLILMHSGHIVIGRAYRTLGSEHLQSTTAKSVKCLRCRHFMTVVPVDIKLCRATFNDIYRMGVPNLVK